MEEVKLKARKREKKEKTSPLERELKLLVETGKIVVGLRKNIKEILLGNVKAVIYASNIPKENLENIRKFASVSNIPAFQFKGGSLELGRLCGRPYPISVIGVYDEGESNLEKLAQLFSK